MAKQTNDSELIAGLQHKATRDAAFTDMMNTYKQRIYYHIRRLVVLHEDAEDLTQETFINAYRYADSLRGDSVLYTWLYRIATNECMKLFKQRKQEAGDLGDVEQKLINDLQADMGDSEDEMLLKFKTAILRLPPKQQAVFNMRYYDDLSYEDIARITDSNVGTLKTNYHYAVEKIKAYLTAQ